MRLEEFVQFFGDAAGFFIEAGAGVEGFGFKNKCVSPVADAVGEIKTDSFDGAGDEFNGEQVVVTSGRLVSEAAFDGGKNDSALLPLQKRRAQMAEKFAARGFEQIEIPRVIDVIPGGALGIGNSMDILETGHGRKIGLET